MVVLRYAAFLVLLCWICEGYWLYKADGPNGEISKKFLFFKDAPVFKGLRPIPSPSILSNTERIRFVDQADFPGLSGKEKRALTMLARWKPFRLNAVGDGRHVIRSPFYLPQEDGEYDQLPLVGRPFRWG